MARRPARARRREAVTALGLAIVALSVGPAAGEDRSLEYPVKAQYLYKLAPFVEWPPAAATSAPPPVTLCVVGVDPFGPILDEAVAGKRIASRPIVVLRLERVDRSAGCQVAYVAGSGAQSVADALQNLRGAPVLTVTDEARGAAPVGIVHFVVRDNRVRFLISPQAAARNGLRISSKLLSLAVGVGAAK